MAVFTADPSSLVMPRAPFGAPAFLGQGRDEQHREMATGFNGHRGWRLRAVISAGRRGEQRQQATAMRGVLPSLIFRP